MTRIPLLSLLLIAAGLSLNLNLLQANEKNIFPRFETTPVPSSDDSADDMAIWVHPKDVKKSKIIGTNKKGGILVYNLQGHQIFHYEKEPINNVDVRYDFPYQGKKIDLVAASSKEKNALLLFAFEGETGKLSLLGNPLTVAINAYGVCLGKDLHNQKFYAFITGKKGSIEQWELGELASGHLGAQKVRTLEAKTQTEGCVVDDEYGTLFAAEEGVGIWKYSIKAKASSKGKLIASIKKNPALKPDLEGVSLYQTRKGEGYLLVSVQTNNVFALFDRRGNHSYLGSFQIHGHGDIDGVTHTDGIDVISTYLGPDFPMGLFIAQDDENKSPQGTLENQNFKFVSWEEIAKKAQNRTLLIDNGWNPRKLTYRRVSK